MKHSLISLLVTLISFLIIGCVTRGPISNGRFVDNGQRLGNSTSYSVALGDMDGDGDLDAFVANGYDQANKVWLNDGGGNFADSGQHLGDSWSIAVVLGDLDSDGDLDAFVGNSGNSPKEANKVWLNDGSGNYTDSGQRLGDPSEAVALGDLDGDGDLDAYFGVSSYLGVHGGNQVWLNDGSGNFADSGQRLESSGWPGSVALGDMDGDGDLDAFVVNWYMRIGSKKVWLNDGTGHFSDSGQSMESSLNLVVALGDLDGDGDLDAFVGNSKRGIKPNKVLLNDGAGSFSDSGQSMGRLGTYSVALGDLDGDGDLDAFVGNISDLPNEVWINKGP